MSKYQPLGAYLNKQFASHIPMTFAEIERVIGTSLPPSAYDHRPWWSNNPSNNVMTKTWLEAGFETEQVDMVSKKLVFRRVKPASPQSGGLNDAPRDFVPADGERKVRRSPLFGALKGTFTIEAGWDLTRPALDPDELAEWEKRLEEKANLYEKGLSGKPR